MDVTAEHLLTALLSLDATGHLATTAAQISGNPDHMVKTWIAGGVGYIREGRGDEANDFRVIVEPIA